MQKKKREGNVVSEGKKNLKGSWLVRGSEKSGEK